MISTSKSFAAWTSVIALAVALVVLAAAGCGTGSKADTSGTTTTIATDGSTGTTVPTVTPDTTADGAALSLTEADNNKSFTVDVGQKIIVVLAGNPSTGYIWESAMAETAAAFLTLDGEPAFVSDSADQNIVGAGGKYTFTFTAVSVGTVDLKLKYWRSFDAQSEPLQTFTASITIK
jgi:inhibitor of cysteine peptidase